MNIKLGVSDDILPYTPLPAEYGDLINTGLLQSFQPEAILNGHEFTGTNRYGRIKVNIAAFTNALHHDLDTAAISVYYDPDEQVSDQVITERLAFTGTPFVLIGRKDQVSPVGINKINGKIEPFHLAASYPYSQVGTFFEKYRADLNPDRISAVKNGTTVFGAFSQLNSFQLRLFALDVTRRQLAQLFGESVSILRNNVKDESLVVDYAVRLLCAIILAHKGRLGPEFTKSDFGVSRLLDAAAKRFPEYFDVSIRNQHILLIQEALARLQQATYSSFTPDMLRELYVSAYRDKEKRKKEGRYDTPLYLTRMILNNMPIETLRPENRLLLDMTCGWGSFLVAGHERLSQISDMESAPLNSHIIGNDQDSFTAQLARVALLTTSLTDSWQVENQDALNLDLHGRQPTIIVGNPPFRGDRKRGAATELDLLTGESKRSQDADQFLAQAIKLLSPGGFLGMLMPKSFSIGESSPAIRKMLLETCDLLEIWDLPDEIFRDQAAVRAMVIFAQKRNNAGYIVSNPVRIRSSQGKSLEMTGVFTASNIAPSQAEWGVSSTKARSSSAKITHLISYTTILSSSEWEEIARKSTTMEKIAYISPGAIVGTKREWKDYPDPKEVFWLPSVKKSLPRSFFIKYGTEKVVYPNELEKPRKNKRFPDKDNEHLLRGPKVLLAADIDPSWGQQAKVAIERRGYFASGGFWVFVPKPGTLLSLEVIAAVLSWDISNAWIVESLRYPWIPRRILSTIPVPALSPEDCNRIIAAVHRIEMAAEQDTVDPIAQETLDEVFIRAYQLDDKTFERLRLVKDWDRRSKEIERPTLQPLKDTLPIQGVVEAVDGRKHTITVWFTGIQGTFVLPIDDSMPGWMLRSGAAFMADVTYRAMMDGDWNGLRWWNIRPQPNDYTFATGSRDGTVRLWSPAPVAGSSHVPFQMLTWATYSPDGGTLAVGEQSVGSTLISEGGLAFYDVEHRTYQKILPHHHDYIRMGAFSRDGARLVTVSQGDALFQRDGKQIFEPPMILLWDAGKRELIAKLSGHTDRVNSAVFSLDGRKLLTASNDGTARLWDAATGSLLTALANHTGVIYDAVFSTDGNRIVTISQDRTAGLWDAQGNLIKKLEGHTNSIRRIAFSPDGSRFATGSDDFSIRVWHTSDGVAAGRLTGHGGAIKSLVFPNNLRILSASEDGTVRLWDLATSKPLVISDKRSYNGGEGAASDDGALISMSWGDEEVHVFDTASGKLVTTLKTLTSEQFQNFFPKSHVLMVTSNYGYELWALPSGKKIGEVPLPFAMGQKFFISPSGDRVAVNDRFGLRDMSIWPTTSSLLAAGKRFSTHDLSTDERFSRFLQ